jgi:hypothetical protein
MVDVNPEVVLYGNQMVTQSERRLGSSLSLADGASGFVIGEWVLVRIPEAIQVGGHIDDDATVVSNLPPTSHGSSLQHAAFIRQVNVYSPTSYLLEVYAIVSFARSGGALAGYAQMNDATTVKQHFHSYLCHAATPRLKLSVPGLILEIGQHLVIHGLVSFRGDSLCPRRGR